MMKNIQTNILSLILSVFAIVSYIQPLYSKTVKKKTPMRAETHCYVVNGSFDVGIGAIFFSLLHLLQQYEQGEISGLRVDMSEGCYLDPEVGPNWWEYFFEPLALGDVDLPEYRLDRRAMGKYIQSGYQLSQSRSRSLFLRYFILKPNLSADFNDQIATLFQDAYVIGVHHRSTDKKTEAKIVSYAKTLEKLEKVISELSEEALQNLKIFVATDEQAFLDMMTELYPGQVVYNDFVRSCDGQALHYSQDLYSSNYQKGKEAIFDCFMLAECDYLIFPASSSYSYFASKVSGQPALKVHPNRTLSDTCQSSGLDP